MKKMLGNTKKISPPKSGAPAGPKNAMSGKKNKGGKGC